MDLDSHPHTQGDGSRDQRTMTVDDDGLAFTGQRFSKTLGLDLNLHANPRASSGFMSTGFGGHYASAFASLKKEILSMKSGLQMIHLSAGSKLNILVSDRQWLDDVVERPVNEGLGDVSPAIKNARTDKASLAPDAVQNVEAIRLTGGYKIREPVFHSVLHARVENFAALFRSVR
jgi:hypothetical protein